MRDNVQSRRRFLSLIATVLVLSPVVWGQFPGQEPSPAPSQPQGQILVSNVRKIYIEKMADNLDQFLASSISSKFKSGSVTVVLNKGDADAILRGVNIGAQTSVQATVQLVDPTEKQIIWSGTASDRSLKTLGMTHGGLQNIADHLIDQMHKAMQR
jgi:hypothetical protein